MSRYRCGKAVSNTDRDRTGDPTDLCFVLIKCRALFCMHYMSQLLILLISLQNKCYLQLEEIKVKTGMFVFFGCNNQPQLSDLKQLNFILSSFCHHLHMAFFIFCVCCICVLSVYQISLCISHHCQHGTCRTIPSL